MSDNGENTPLVVGIGASAGGLEAFILLLNNLPDYTGMAFVLVQHLDPKHESVLAALLGTHTRMPVEQATQGTRPLPNHVYIIPPTTRMALREGVLNLSPRLEDRSRNLPIDYFLCSLAESQKSRAIGVILSGSASDGTIGMKAIKEEGGITFAQDGTAAFDSMPRNAVAAGVVDFVLPPAGIAGELAKITTHSYFGVAEPEAPTLDGTVLLKVLRLLRRSTGVDFTHYKMPTIQRRLARRMALKSLEDAGAYAALMEQDATEVQALFHDVLIGVTEFFRDPATFTALLNQVFPAITKGRRSQSPLRIWIPGCSTGEEVYSVAICLLEHLENSGETFAVQIFGTDLSEQAIQTARAGRYSAEIKESVSPERLQKYFVRMEQGGYQIGQPVRELCIFSRHDLTKDPPLSKMDLISCRNLLIYLGPILQKRVLATFNHSLNPSGFLLLGNSENASSLSEHFLIFDKEHKLYVRNLQVPQPALEAFEPEVRDKKGRGGKPVKDDESASTLDREADRLILDQHSPGGLIVNGGDFIVKFRGKVRKYLAWPEASLGADLFSAIRQDLAKPVRAAVEEARVRRSVVRVPRISDMRTDRLAFIQIVVQPLRKNGDEHLLVLFEEQEVGLELNAPAGDLDSSREKQELWEELASTRVYLQSLIKELRTANEETQSTNEELQSTNEELQTAKEELQSSNEELSTTNDEMKSRNTDLSQVNYDLVNLLSSLQVPIVMLSKDLRIRRFTPLAEKALNLIPTDVGRPILDLRPRINVPDLGELLSRVVQQQFAHEQEVQDVDGHWYSMRLNPYWIAENRAEGVVLQLLDIDQLKRNFESIQYAKNYSEAIYSAVREPLVVLDSDLRVEKANRSFFEVFQVTPEKTLQQSIFDLGGGQWNLPRVRDMLEQALSGSQVAVDDVEVEHDFARIGWRTFQLNVQVLKRDGRATLVLLALEDISARKRVRIAEAKYRRLFETAKDGIILVDAHTGEITDVNPYVSEVSGFQREELLGKRFWATECFRAIPGGADSLPRIVDEKVVRFSDLAMMTKEHRQIETEIVANAYDDGGKAVIQLNIRDITERKHFERQLRQSAKLESLGVLAGGVAHDFNNLLTGILGNASLLLEDMQPENPDRAMLREIIRASQHAADLTRQMLAYSGRGRFVVGPTSVSDLVKEVSSLIRSSIPRSVDIELALKPNLSPVDADATQLQQLVMNMVLNAGEAIEEGSHGTIRVATREDWLDRDHLRLHFAAEEMTPGRYVVVEVSDSGCGMDEETKAKIFDPFFTTKFTGRGLGLAAALGVVTGHRGAIRVYSSPGHGTTFRVFLPVSVKAVEPEAPSEKPRDLSGKGAVLVVDDEEIVLRTATAALVRSGYEVLSAPNGLEAIRIVEQRGAELSLVILDLTMPVMSGEDTLAQVKRIRPDLPVVLSSGYDESQAVRRFEGNNLAGFIQKPYTVTKLLETVKGVIL